MNKGSGYAVLLNGKILQISEGSGAIRKAENSRFRKRTLIGIT
jgi:hypothetical protein